MAELKKPQTIQSSLGFKMYCKTIPLPKPSVVFNICSRVSFVISMF